MVELLHFDTGKYDACWFEIKLPDKKIVTRDCHEFLRKTETLSHIHEITLYKVEQSVCGFKKSRIHAI